MNYLAGVLLDVVQRVKMKSLMRQHVACIVRLRASMASGTRSVCYDEEVCPFFLDHEAPDKILSIPSILSEVTSNNKYD
jgi:hypothetical protein